MLGGKNRQPLGYTIIEVMIVLVISGTMFLIASTFINGKQQTTAFKAGVNQMASQIQNTIEEVTDGRYSDILLNCTASVGPNSAPTFPIVGTNEQGANQDCTFRGKLIHFWGSPMSNYEIVSLADIRADTNTESTSISPSVVGIQLPNSNSLTTQSAIPDQLVVKKFEINGALSTKYNVAFLQSLGNASGNGAQSIELAYANNLGTASIDGSESSITGGSANMPIRQSVTICLSDGSHFATIDVGATDQNQLSVNTQLGLTVCP